MAEALGLYGGIVPGLGTLSQLSQVLIEYLRHSADANEEKKQLRTEVTATGRLLQGLRGKAQAPEWKKKLELLDRDGGPLKLIKSALEALEAKAKPSANRFKKLTKPLIWHFEKGEY